MDDPVGTNKKRNTRDHLFKKSKHAHLSNYITQTWEMGKCRI